MLKKEEEHGALCMLWEAFEFGSVCVTLHVCQSWHSTASADYRTGGCSGSHSTLDESYKLAE